MPVTAHHLSRARAGAAWLVLILVATAPATDAWGAQIDLTELSIEDLMNIEVVSVARKEQSMFLAPAAVFVLTAEDLRRSGVTSIPEALRLVPGVQVGRMDANKWAISARGFNDFFANKLLVLIDGRSVYTPVFSGVFWETHDVVLEDLERIEVIRGPGGTLWGANAVNGVINIITRKASDTLGGAVRVGIGTEERGFGSVRFGSQLGERSWYRVYAKHTRRSGSETAGGEGLGDSWHMGRAGARLDWDISDQTALTLQGELHRGEVGHTFQLPTSLHPPPIDTYVDDGKIIGWYALGRWKRQWGEISDLEVQAYLDRGERRGEPVGGAIRTLDVDMQHRVALPANHEIVWGMGGRFIRDRFENSYALSLDPASRSTRLLSAFFQDEVRVMDERLRLTAGSKVEHNGYTGFEVQPNLRLVWSPTGRTAVWGAVSRAVRTPSRGEIDERFNGTVYETTPLTLVAVFGNREFRSESLVAFDLGYRTHVGDQLTLDLAGFYNVYDDLRTGELELPPWEMEETPAPAHLLAPVITDNKLHGITYGLEAVANWQALDTWRLHAAYTYLQMDMELDEGSLDPAATTWDEENPNHQVTVRSSWDALNGLSLDAALRYMDELPILDTDRYLAADVRLGWHPIEQGELFLVGQHLLAGPHMEFPRQNVISLPGQVRSGVYGGMSWQF